MNSTLRSLQLTRIQAFRNRAIFMSTSKSVKHVPRPSLRKTHYQEEIFPYKWFMLVIPVTSFGLGVWQVKRKFWKENLVLEMNERLGSAPLDLPENMEELAKLEYRPVHVRGTFLHDKEMYMGPRGLIPKNQTESKSLMQDTHSQGYLVVTPFKLADRDEIILVNRGWVPSHKLKPQSRTEGQVEGVVDVIGLVRLHEPRPNFAIKNKEGSNLYFYRDLYAMCQAAGASPIFLDQTTDYNVSGGPIGGQTKITLRNEHLSYIITWFALSAATGYMWIKMFVLKR